MKLQIIKIFFGPGLDGGAGGNVAASGGNPYIAAAQAGVGTIQSILGFIRERKAEKQLEKMQSPTYVKNQSILDYYNQALSRYGASPTESALYKRQTQNINRNIAGGISSLQTRRTGQAGIPALISAQNNALLDAEVAAENQQNQRFRELGSATGMKAGEDRLAYQYNELAPFERKYNLLSAKAGGGAQIANAGLSNIFGGLNTAQQYSMLNKTYGK